MMNRIDAADIKRAAKLATLDDGLAHVMAIMDPSNEHDLGGCAGLFFSSPHYRETEKAWPMEAEDVRAGILAEWLAFEHAMGASGPVFVNLRKRAKPRRGC